MYTPGTRHILNMRSYLVKYLKLSFDIVRYDYTARSIGYDNAMQMNYRLYAWTKYMASSLDGAPKHTANMTTSVAARTLLGSFFFTCCVFCHCPRVAWCVSTAFNKHHARRHYGNNYTHAGTITGHTVYVQFKCSSQLIIQESWAIAKMTARCALCMGALKIFRSPWQRPRLPFPNF